MKIAVLSALAATAVFAAPGMAQELDPYFTGPRVEARVGYDNVTIRGTVSDGVDTFSRSESNGGATYGGEIGYDQAINNLVLGGYVGLEGSSVEECGELYGADELCLGSGRNITVGARLGAAIGSTMMVYGKGGYSNGQARLDYQDYELIIPDYNESETIDGFHLGAGLEAGLPGGVYGRVEYVYTDYGEATARFEDVTLGVQTHRHQAVFGLGMRF
jgi:outer membrane immunogenic protein